MRKIFYNYYIPFRNLFKYDEDIEKIGTWKEFRQEWDNDESLLVILPVGVFDLTGLDIRYYLREFGRNDNVRFLFIGTTKQIEFVLSQNDKFLGNIIDQVVLPMDFDIIEPAILKKIDRLEKQTKGKK
jgi:hypothetical protein